MPGIGFILFTYISASIFYLFSFVFHTQYSSPVLSSVTNSIYIRHSVCSKNDFFFSFLLHHHPSNYLLMNILSIGQICFCRRSHRLDSCHLRKLTLTSVHPDLSPVLILLCYCHSPRCPAEWAGQRCELLDNLSVQDKYSRMYLVGRQPPHCSVHRTRLAMNKYSVFVVMKEHRPGDVVVGSV